MRHQTPPDESQEPDYCLLLKELQVQEGLTQREMAEVMGMSLRGYEDILRLGRARRLHWQSALEGCRQRRLRED